MTGSLTESQESTKPSEIIDFKQKPRDDPNDVLFGSHYGVRTIELNRPNKLNALNASMARKIIARLKVYILLLALCLIVIIAHWKTLYCRNGENPS